MMEEAHPIDVDLERILPILAREIYTSPFAFLRENVQNAFDAIRMQVYRDKIEAVTREHKIVITLEGNRLSISDTGVGMSQEDLASFYWSIGKSGNAHHRGKSRRSCWHFRDRWDGEFWRMLTTRSSNETLRIKKFRC